MGHGDVMPGLHARELQEQHPEIYALRGSNGALEAPDELIQHAHKIQTYKTAIPTEHYPTNWVVDRTIEFLEEVDGPFFAFCSINDPHHPFCPPGDYWHKFTSEDMPAPIRQDGELEDKPPHFRGFYNGDYKDIDTDGFLLGSEPYLSEERVQIIRAAYYGMVALIDDGIARIMDALRSRNLEENTIVLFLSDHGELLGDHGLILKGAFHYQTLMQVPLFAYAPGLIPAGHVVDGPVGLIDLYATLLELAGCEMPEGTQAESLVPQLVGKTSSGREQVYIDRWRVTHYAGEEYGELYDLERDPNEFVNLWDRDVNTRRELQAQLLDVMTQNQSWLPPKVSHA